MLPDVRGKSVLMLQGPVGPFFARFAAELGARGARVAKVNFNGGDAWYYRRPGAVAYRGEPDAWPIAFDRLLDQHAVDLVFVFGDCRSMHRAAIPVARARGVPVYVFEEGYVRPDWVTLELGGVNGHSSLPRDPETYRRAAAALPEPPRAEAVGNTFYAAGWWAIIYAIWLTLGWRRYPHYRHHRDLNAFRECVRWWRGFLRKPRYALRERGRMAELVRRPGGFFLLPLQVATDAQFHHSPYQTMEQVIDEVATSFAAHAAADAWLVVKHHPLDRPYTDYTRYLAAVAARHGLEGRLLYIHDQHLPTVLKAARGVVTMNSTVGTQALRHGTPVKVLGRAIYDLPGLTHQGPLADFFRDPGAIDAALLDAFVRYLRATNQINGSFYRRVKALGTVSGLDAAAFSPAPAAAEPAAPPAPSGHAAAASGQRA